jgi:hypothetical protein
MTADAASFAEVSCPLCHAQAPALTGRALAAGEAWHCPQCHIAWSLDRLATVAAHAEYCAQRDAS